MSLVWNANILRPMLDFRSSLSEEIREIMDRSRVLIAVTQGYCGVVPLALSGSSTGPLHLSLISRLGWKRAGARYKTRGVDDDGNVANFVEVRYRNRAKLEASTLIHADIVIIVRLRRS